MYSNGSRKDLQTEIQKQHVILQVSEDRDRARALL